MGCSNLREAERGQRLPGRARSAAALGGGTGGEFSGGSDQGPCSPVLSSTRPTVSFTANNGREDASTPKAMPCGLPVWRGRCHHPGVRGMRITRPGGTPGNARSSRNNTAASLESGVYDGAAGTKPAPGRPSSWSREKRGGWPRRSYLLSFQGYGDRCPVGLANGMTA